MKLLPGDATRSLRGLRLRHNRPIRGGALLGATMLSPRTKATAGQANCVTNIIRGRKGMERERERGQEQQQGAAAKKAHGDNHDRHPPPPHRHPPHQPWSLSLLSCRHRPPRALQGVTRHLPDGAHLACLALPRFTSGRILDHQVSLDTYGDGRPRRRSGHGGGG